MKITDLAIAFTAIFFPVFLILGMRSDSLEQVRYVEMTYTSALRTAVQDGAAVLNVNEAQQYEAAYASLKYTRVDKEQALEAFSRTLYHNMGIGEDPVAQEALWWYIPAVAVIDYDGYYVYALQDYEGPGGESLLQHQWTPKIPFAWTDGEGSSVHFSLDEYVEVYESGSGRWLSGFRSELAHDTSVTLLGDKDRFDQVRRRAIVNAVQEDLAYYISRHNELALRNGVSYRFALPVIPQEEWMNTVDDVGMMAFIQGLPIGEQHYNNYALGGGRLVKSPVYVGGVDPVSGLKYYYRSFCPYTFEAMEVFPGPKAAAAAGYMERSCSNPGVI
ncbi:MULTISPECIES: hypothetical protein [Paenibacillus]|uniref:F0F1-type ATP synthase n=1 Tax=Paenibacillus campinasensis TaxID=66347 RepID=A0A268F1W5_9BACL|nr:MULTISPECIES: hypothetical protein [Paenibacillus]PAD79360.1 hypothetical protein CHH67_03890 [Paenibacillus campinasensis]PAK51697.1 hypothetical protein CHH75_14110 [Paenibacillus sp. 7541]